jgi:Tubulin domain
MEIRRTVNVARSLQGIAAQVSAYIPLSNPPSSMPEYVRLDPYSEWSKSSLQCTAVETMTLPTRLRKNNDRAGSLGELEGVLNNTGSRTIFELRSSIYPREGTGEEAIPDERERRPTRTSGTSFDIDYSPRRSRNKLGRTPHRFSQVEVRRCIPESQIPSESKGRVKGEEAASIQT